MEMFQSNIYYKLSLKGYIVSTQELCLRKRFLCMHKILVHAQDSCACTTLLRIHNTLVHALEGPGTKAGAQNKTAAGPARAAPPVHAQEFCACTRILCMHKNFDIFDMLCVENPPTNQTVCLSPKSDRKPSPVH